MHHPYQSRTHSRDRRLAQPAAEGSNLASWIVAGCFIFILGYAFVLPILRGAL